MNPPSFKFNYSPETASHNWAILTSFNLDLGKALESHKNTPLELVSEFKPTSLLDPILKNHPLWHRMKRQLEFGASYNLEDLDKTMRIADIKGALEFGNHMGEQKNDELFLILMKDDVGKGFIW